MSSPRLRAFLQEATRTVVKRQVSFPQTQPAVNKYSATDPNKQSQSDDQNIGSAQKDPANSNSASSLITTLVPVLVIAVIWLTVFTLVRTRASWKYAPRTSAKTLEQQYAINHLILMSRIRGQQG